MKLWLLDADVVIKFLELDIFDRLAEHHQLFAASTVVDEVKYFRRNREKIFVAFRQKYVESGRVAEMSATIEEVSAILQRLPVLRQQAIHAGELESLAVLVRKEEMTLCTFDAAVIHCLPYLDVVNRATSAERLLSASGLTLSPSHRLDPRLTESYFKSNMDQGQKEYICSFGKGKK